MKIPVVREILSLNNDLAVDNRRVFDTQGVFVLNLMSSPGAGKTSLILATARQLGDDVRVGVIEGDLASTIDAEIMAAHGLPVVQINTGGNCHLDAPQVRSALDHLPLGQLDLVFIENVGNLVCTANFELGAHLAVVVASVPEGHDKPYKYPGIFASADVVILNKSDLIAVFDFDVDYFTRGVRLLNLQAPIFLVSSRSGKGIDDWVAWLAQQRQQRVSTP